MITSLQSYIKHCVPADELTVNRLFVSAYISCCGLVVPQSSFLLKYVICEGDHDADLLTEVRRRVTTDVGRGLNLEVLIRLFEFVVSPADRIVTGAVYTPERVRNNILSRCLSGIGDERLRELRIADISCGCGGFLVDAAKLLHDRTGRPYAAIYRDNIFGIDIEHYATERTKILLSLQALSAGEDADFEFNLLTKDTLDYASGDWDDRYRNFDIIVGNPPYVCSRNLSKEAHDKLKNYEVCSSGHPDLYIPFFQIAIEMLADTGRLGFITMNTFLRSVNGRALRRYFSDNRFDITIVDFRGYQIFESKNTYTCLFFLDKRQQSNTLRYATDEDGKLLDTVALRETPYAALDSAKGWSLNNFEVAEMLESAGLQIKDYCPSRHGLATLSNDTYIFKPVAMDREFFYLEKGGEKLPIERGVCRDIINPNRLNSIDDIESLKEKVIFPYRVAGGKATLYEPVEIERLFPCALAYLQKCSSVLSERDKGDTSTYPQWYAFGRTQSLVLPRYKLFFPKFANRAIRCLISDAPDLMLYNGLAFVSDDERKLRVLKRVIESELFWSYIQANGKPYASGYYSLSGVDIKHFSIPVFTEEEENALLTMNDKGDIDRWLRRRYGMDMDGSTN